MHIYVFVLVSAEQLFLPVSEMCRHLDNVLGIDCSHFLSLCQPQVQQPVLTLLPSHTSDDKHP